MLFWIYLTVVSLLFPWIMNVLGQKYVQDTPDQSENYAYHTKRSMASQEAWEFAHHYLGQLLCPLGRLLMLVSVVAMAFTWGKDTLTITVVCLLLVFFQLIGFFVARKMTDAALKKEFDR